MWGLGDSDGLGVIEGYEDEDSIVNTLTVFRERSLKSPIRSYPIYLLANPSARIKASNTTSDRLKEQLTSADILLKRIQATFQRIRLSYEPTQLLLAVWGNALNPLDGWIESRSEFQDACSVGVKLTELNELILSASGEPALVRDFSPVEKDESIIELFAKSKVLGSIVDILSREGFPSKYPTGFTSDGKVLRSASGDVWIGNGCACIVIGDHCYFGFSDVMRMASDMVQQILLTKLVVKLAPIYNIPTYPSERIASDVLDWGFGVLGRLGNSGYEIILKLEEVAIAALIEGKPGEVDPFVDHDFYRFVISRDPEYPEEEYIRLRSLIDRLRTESSSAQISEIFGFFRFWGHPRVYGVEGTQKIAEIGRAKKYLDFNSVERVSAKFTEMFVRAYHKKHGLWPPCSMAGSGCEKLRSYKSRNAVPMKGDPKVLYTEWNRITFEQTFDPDLRVKLSEIVEDKSTSPSLPDLKKSWEKNRIFGEKRHKSLILQWLDSNLSVEDLISSISRNGFPQPDKVIGLTSKEREIKLKPRMFSLMTFYVRMYVVVTESLMATHILPYFNAITMTFNQLKLQKALHAIGSQQSDFKDDPSVTITINMDFKKWNHNMRDELCRPIFRKIDQLLGFSLVIERTHDLFKESMYYNAEEGSVLKFDREEMLQSNATFRGTLGGQEGLRQKGWTLVTVAALHCLIDDSPHDFRLLGQGDNQVLSMTIRYPTNFSPDEASFYVRNELYEFRKCLHRFFDSLGLPIKSAETWSSSRLHSYGKRHTYRGACLPMATKRLVRCFARSNEMLPSLEADVSAIWSAASAACEFDPFPLIPIFVAGFQTHIALKTHLDYSILLGKSLSKAILGSKGFNADDGALRVNCSKDVLRRRLNKRDTTLSLSICLRPKVLGGFGVFLILDLWLKGNADPLTSSVAQLRKILGKIEDPELKEIIKNILRPYMSSRINALNLLQNPNAVNVVASPTTENVLKERSVQFMEGFEIKNKHLQNVFQGNSDRLRSLADNLIVCRPLIPAIMADVMSASITGYIHTVSQKCSQTTTIRRSASAALSSNSFLSDERIADIELRTLPLHILTVFCSSLPNTRLDMNPGGCSRSLCHAQRCRSWNIPEDEFLGVTNPSPLEMLLDPEDAGGCRSPEADDYLHTVLSPDINDTNWADVLSSPGPYQPYYGSETREKITSKVEMIYEKEEFLRKVHRLTQTVPWVFPMGSEAQKMIQNLCESVTDIPFDLLTASDHSSGGNPLHRYIGSYGTRTCRINLTPNLLSYISINTNTLGRFAKGGFNTTIHFQSLMLVAAIRTMYQVYRAKVLGDALPLDIHYHLGCSSCIEYIDDLQIEGDGKWSGIKFESRPDNEYLFQRQQESHVKNRLHVTMTLKSVDLSRYDPRMMKLLILYSIACKVVSEGEIEDEHALVPWVWFAYITPSEFFLSLAIYATAQACRTLIHDLYRIDPPNISSISAFATRVVNELSDQALFMISGVYIDPHAIENLSNTYEGDTRPPAIIPSRSAICANIRESVLARVGDAIRELSNWDSRWKTVVPGGATPADVQRIFSTLFVLDSKLWRRRKEFFAELEQMKTREYSLSISKKPLDGLVKSLPRLRRSKRLSFKGAVTLVPGTSWISLTTSAVGVVDSRMPWKLLIRTPTVITGAFYKYYDYVSEFVKRRPHARSALVVGDGTGGVSSLCILSGLQVTYHALLNHRKVSQQGFDVRVPPAFDFFIYDLNSHLQGAHSLTNSITDASSRGFAESQTRRLRNAVPDLIIIDIEGSVWRDSYREVIRELLMLIRDSGAGEVCLKLYSRPLNNFKWIHGALMRHTTCTWYASSWSNPSTSELFCVITKVDGIPDISFGYGEKGASLAEAQDKAGVEIRKMAPRKADVMLVRNFLRAVMKASCYKKSQLSRFMPGFLGDIKNIDFAIPYWHYWHSVYSSARREGKIEKEVCVSLLVAVIAWVIHSWREEIVGLTKYLKILSGYDWSFNSAPDKIFWDTMSPGSIQYWEKRAIIKKAFQLAAALSLSENTDTQCSRLKIKKPVLSGYRLNANSPLAIGEDYIALVVNDSSVPFSNPRSVSELVGSEIYPGRIKSITAEYDFSLSSLIRSHYITLLDWSSLIEDFDNDD